MDEMLRGKLLREQILQRCISIKSDMKSINSSLDKMQQMETKAPTPEAPIATRLTDLPTDNLRQVIACIGASGDYKQLCHLSRSCKLFLQLVNTDQPCWEVLCRKHWKVRERDPHRAPRMDTTLLNGLPGLGLFCTPSQPEHRPSNSGSGSSPRGERDRLPTLPSLGSRWQHTSGISPKATSAKANHRASDPVGSTSDERTRSLASTASGSARQAALTLRQQQQQQQLQLGAGPPQRSTSGGLCGTPYAPPLDIPHSDNHSERERENRDSHSVEGSPSARSGASPNPSGVGGRLGQAGAIGVDSPRGNGSCCGGGSAASSPGAKSSRHAHAAHTQPAGVGDGSQAGKGGVAVKEAPSLREQGPTRAMPPELLASLCRFGSVGGTASRATGEPLAMSLRHSLSMGSGWHGSGSSSSSSRRATVGGDALGLATYKTGVMSAASGNVWRQLCRDRVQGWRLVLEMLAWLQQHHHPSTVSGSMHRLQQLIALRYLGLFTQHPEDTEWRQSLIKLDCLKSLLALTENENGAVVEMALHILANHMLGDASMKVTVNVGSRMGKSFLDKLDASEKHPSIVREASRVLATLWAEDPCPEVRILTPFNTPARPDLIEGTWIIQEFSTRGDPLRLLEVDLTFGEAFDGSTVEVNGTGHERAAAYAEEERVRVNGSIEVGNGAWHLRRYVRQAPTVFYEGYNDLKGAWGVYYGQRGAGLDMHALNRGMQPRVFRLFRKSRRSSDGNEEGLWS